MIPKQVAITPAIAKCARCGASARCVDWNYRDRWRVWCDNNHTSTKECGTIHRAICRWNNAQARFTTRTLLAMVSDTPTPGDPK